MHGTERLGRMMYENIIKALRLCVKYNKAMDALMNASQAADAIEELDTLLDGVRADNDALCETIEMLKKQVFDMSTLIGDYSENTRWIPVTERLPEDLQTVLVVRKDGGIYCWMYSACSPTDEVWCDEYANAFSVYDVTHWIPLPEPPKEEARMTVTCTKCPCKGACDELPEDMSCEDVLAYYAIEPPKEET